MDILFDNKEKRTNAKIWILYGLIAIIGFVLAFAIFKVNYRLGPEPKEVCILRTPAYIEWECPYSKNEIVTYDPVSCLTYHQLKQQACNITKSQGQTHCFQDCKYLDSIRL